MYQFTAEDQNIKKKILKSFKMLSYSLLQKALLQVLFFQRESILENK